MLLRKSDVETQYRNNLCIPDIKIIGQSLQRKRRGSFVRWHQDNGSFGTELFRDCFAVGPGLQLLWWRHHLMQTTHHGERRLALRQWTDGRMLLLATFEIIKAAAQTLALSRALQPARELWPGTNSSLLQTSFVCSGDVWSDFPLQSNRARINGGI